MTELFITGLPFAATEETIVEFFSDDQCTSVELQRYEDGRSKGRAFVRFEDEDTAQKVFDGRKEMEMEGRKLFIDFTGSKSVFGCKLFVKGLPWGATEEEVAALECFAGVESVEILKFEDGKSKGVGFLKFGTFEDAEALSTGGWKQKWTIGGCGLILLAHDLDSRTVREVEDVDEVEADSEAEAGVDSTRTSTTKMAITTKTDQKTM